MTKNKKAEEIAFSRCDVPERTKRFALQYVSEAYAGIKNCRECEFYNTCDRIDSVRAELRKKKKEGMKNMTEQETREKIFNIIREFNVKKRRYSTHTEPSDDDELADALIAAGIRDMSDIRALADNVMLSVIAHKSEVGSMEQRAKEAELRAEVAESEIERYTGLIKPLEDENTRLNHRAEVAERALDRACEKVFLLSDNCRYSNLKDDVRDSIKLRRSDVENFIAVVREKFLQQAEKELEEEGKDEQN